MINNIYICIVVFVCSELMPPLPKGGVFEIEEIINTKRHIATKVSLAYVHSRHVNPVM